MDRHAFEQMIARNWAAHFGVAPDVVQQPGTTLLAEEKFRGGMAAALWHVGRHTFVQHDPELSPLLAEVLSRLPPAAALSGAEMERLAGPERIRERDSGPTLYVFPDDLPACSLPAAITLRALDGGDLQALAALKADCQPEDVEEAYVEVDHDAVFGCFEGLRLVAVASGYFRTGFVDIGVLTHPGCRRMGLGRAVVAALSRWALAGGHLPQYRHMQTNTRSAALARSLNFKEYVRSEVFWMKTGA